MGGLHVFGFVYVLVVFGLQDNNMEGQVFLYLDALWMPMLPTCKKQQFQHKCNCDISCEISSMLCCINVFWTQIIAFVFPCLCFFLLLHEGGS